MIAFDPSSFRDPSGRLFRHGGSIYRTSSPESLGALQDARDSGLLDYLEQQDLLEPTTAIETAKAGLPEAELGPVLLRQREIPFVSYSYEWSFSMLRDAALVTLRGLEAALDRGFVLKDATAFNVVFDGTVPRLVDVHSLERRREGTLWVGYAQFCRAFLFPLFLMTYRGIHPQPLLLSGLGEIPVDVAAPLFRWRDRFKPGVMTNVILQAGLEKRFGARTKEISRASSGLNYPLSALVSQVQKLRRLVETLQPPAEDHWASYEQTHSYGADSLAAKDGFVQRSLARVAPATVLDLGTNTGRYARIGRALGARVVAVDLSASSIDRLYRETGRDPQLCPVVADLARPTPAIGWRLTERQGLLARLRADVSLALALVHHLRIAGGIPLAEILALLTSLSPTGVVEWVGKDDDMVKQLLSLIGDVFDDYTEQHFEQLLTGFARIVDRHSLPGGQRTLYFWDRH